MRAQIRSRRSFPSGHAGPWKDSGKIRSAAPVHSEEFKECVALQAQYIFDHFGKFPGTAPSMIATIYLQAHHLDLEFYDEFYKPGAYLQPTLITWCGGMEPRFTAHCRVGC